MMSGARWDLCSLSFLRLQLRCVFYVCCYYSYVFAITHAAILFSYGRVRYCDFTDYLHVLNLIGEVAPQLYQVVPHTNVAYLSDTYVRVNDITFAYRPQLLFLPSEIATCFVYLSLVGTIGFLPSGSTAWIQHERLPQVSSSSIYRELRELTTSRYRALTRIQGSPLFELLLWYRPHTQTPVLL